MWLYYSFIVSYSVDFNSDENLQNGNRQFGNRQNGNRQNGKRNSVSFDKNNDYIFRLVLAIL